ncbi:MAG TPA: metalloregulator ArsR/SmtB family transcription factor [Pirellulaceae bacterium]|nr:metalloregulator ArsR/SmtB family transcription factor [Pirellulaceae bacterium]
MQDASEFADCARRLKALADPERLKIIDLLFAGAKNVSDLATELGAEIVNVSHHLGVLRNAGLVRVERQGRFMIYSLAPDIVTPPASESGKHLDLGCCSFDLTAGADKKPGGNKK